MPASPVFRRFQYGISKSWLYELLARYRAEGAAFEPRSRRPLTSPTATPDIIDTIVRLT